MVPSTETDPTRGVSASPSPPDLVSNGPENLRLYEARCSPGRSEAQRGFHLRQTSAGHFGHRDIGAEASPVRKCQAPDGAAVLGQRWAGVLAH